ncbi:MAG: oligosaccharide flippase family protein [Deltaproteobacteria bacterium]|nr:oligosaccharide flippase family protein [Deltaproteobacteria bacterium]
MWDWSFAVFMILGACRDLGLPAHILRVKDRPFGNLLWVESLWGGTLMAGLVLAAPLVAMAFQEPDPRVVPVLQALAVFILLEGLAQVPLVYFEGELAIGRSLLPEMLRSLCFAVVAVGMAFAGYGIWSLVWAQLSSSALFTLTLWMRAWGKMPLLWLRGKSLSLLWESLPLGFIWLLMLALRHVDPLILGVRFSARELGMYTFAYWAAFLVATLLIHPIGRALYPALVNLEAQKRSEPFDAYRLATLALLAVEVPAALFLFFNADLVISILGGGRWEESPSFLRVLCFAPLVDPIGRFAGQFLAARRQERLWILSAVITLVTWTVAGLVLTHRWGPIGMAYANFLPLGAVVSAWAIYRIDPRRCRRLGGELTFLYLVPLPFFGLAAFVSAPESWARFVLCAAAAAIAAALYYWRFGQAFQEFFGSKPGVETPG